MKFDEYLLKKQQQWDAQKSPEELVAQARRQAACPHDKRFENGLCAECGKMS